MRYDNMNKFKKKEEKELEEKKPKEVKLKSEMYNQDNEKIIKREEEEANNKAIMWGFVLGFILFLILFIFIIVFVK